MKKINLGAVIILAMFIGYTIAIYKTQDKTDPIGVDDLQGFDNRKVVEM